MKTDVKGCSTCPIGKESYETFYSSSTKSNFVQYDFRDIDGELFSTIALDLDFARKMKNIWLQKKQKN